MLGVEIETTPELVSNVYEKLKENISKYRDAVGRPLTLTEKILSGHLHEMTDKPFDGGKDYVFLKPDRVALQDVTGQMVMLQFMQAGLKQTSLPAADSDPNANGGGCLIATAAYGTELAPQVQLLREVRDNILLSTESGTSFMSGFNDVYYSFSPAVADLERESPVFRDAVKLFITPMLSTLSIMALADEGSELQVLALGVAVIALNLGMYAAVPVSVGLAVRKYQISRR